MKWSEMTVQQHLDAAGELFAKHLGAPVNGLHKDMIEAQAHVNAALALSNERLVVSR